LLVLYAWSAVSAAKMTNAPAASKAIVRRRELPNKNLKNAMPEL
jgi:hypothetical protein